MKTVSKKVGERWYNFCGICGTEWPTSGAADKCGTGYFPGQVHSVKEKPSAAKKIQDRIDALSPIPLTS